MRAVLCSNAELAVAERPEPVPGRGQVRIEVLRCGICGSDLHARHGCDEWAEMAARTGYDRFARSNEEIVFGHEFCGEVVEHGPQCRKGVPAGTRVVALPLLRGSRGVDPIGLSVHAPGAYAEQMLVEESLMMPVPNGLEPDVAALTEPLAVGWHAVRRGEVGKRTVAIVIGCGPIGLAVILLLKAKGVRTVVASDYSPARRALASACGADVVLDPAHESPYTAVKGRGHLTDAPAAFELAVSTREKLERLPFGWWHAWRLGEALGARPKHPVIFECVGVPGVIESIIDGARCSRASSWSGCASVSIRSRPRWRSTRRSTCASRSATRRWSSATRCTCSPRATSTRGRSSPGLWDWTASRPRRSARPSGRAREDPGRPAHAAERRRCRRSARSAPA